MAKASSRWIGVFEEFIKDIRISSKESVSTDERGSPLVLWESQKRFLEHVGRGLDDDIRIFNCLKSRQLGVTTISLAIDVLWLAMHPNLIGCLVADTEKNINANRSLIEKYVKSFPDGYFGDDFRVTKSNRSFIEFSNKSRLNLLVAGTKKKGVSWAEGVGYAFAHLTETSKYGDPDALASLEESFAQQNPNRLFIYESTANGTNHWMKRWQAGQKDVFTQRSFFLGWWSSDVNIIKRNDPRFTQYGGFAASGDEREKIAAVARLYGYKITPEQLAWIRWKSDNTGSDNALLEQNQPWCLVAGTRVGTNRGILRIEDVRPGDATTLGAVIHAGQTGVSKIWRARTTLGYELFGTGNHPLIGADGNEVEISKSLGKKVRLAQPKFADDLCTVKWRNGVVDCSVEITPEFARLVGIFMGDGSLSGQGNRGGFQFAITCDSKDDDVIAECHRLIQSQFGVNSQQYSYREIGDGGWTTVKTTSKLIYETFKSLGLVAVIANRTQRIVHVPDFIWKSPKHVIKEFLSGLFETDGFCGLDNDRVVLASKHDQFMRDVQILLLGFGITSKSHPYVTKKRADGKRFYSTTMALRKLESLRFHDEIGFLSKRKKARAINRPVVKNAKISALMTMPIVFEDTIAEVEETDRIEPVYNLHVDGNHWFDANGIVTHNTERDAFIESGYSFFQTRQISMDLKTIREGGEDYGFQAYRYEIDGGFFNMKLEKIEDEADMDRIELKVWEEPVPNGKYAIGFDPAWGRNDHKDRSCCQVYRCYADKIVQVAEYATADVELKHAAWCLAHLAGCYKDCVVIPEITGPGRALFMEWDHLKQMMQSETYRDSVVNKSVDWEAAFENARWYLYSRPDSMGKGFALGFETSWRTKAELMHQMRGEFVTKSMIVRSIPLLNEMLNVIVDEGGSIGAPESSNADMKDDRVFATALAIRAWINWIRPSMLADGMTYKRVNEEESGDVTPLNKSLNNIVFNFFRSQQELAEAEPDKPTWLTDRGLI